MAFSSVWSSLNMLLHHTVMNYQRPHIFRLPQVVRKLPLLQLCDGFFLWLDSTLVDNVCILVSICFEGIVMLFLNTSLTNVTINFLINIMMMYKLYFNRKASYCANVFYQTFYCKGHQTQSLCSCTVMHTKIVTAITLQAEFFF